MRIFVEIFNLAAIKSLIIGIPEAVGLLVFGLGLVVIAVLLRRRLGRNNDEQSCEALTNEVTV